MSPKVAFPKYSFSWSIFNMKQESPPAWTQEAYRLPRSKCSLCWSVSRWQEGTHSVLDGEGYPHPVLDGWYSPQSWSWMGVPPSSRIGYSPSRPGMGYPASAGWDTPIQTWDGVPPQQDGVPPSGPGTGYPSLSRPGMGYPHSDLGWGTSLVQTWHGVPPSQLAGAPSPFPANVNRQTPVKT